MFQQYINMSSKIQNNWSHFVLYNIYHISVTGQPTIFYFFFVELGSDAMVGYLGLIFLLDTKLPFEKKYIYRYGPLNFYVIIRNFSTLLYFGEWAHKDFLCNVHMDNCPLMIANSTNNPIWFGHDSERM